MLTKVAGLEQGTEKNPATIFSLSPGIIDTGMQELIRQQDETNFPERNTFYKLYEEGRLSSPADIANIILRTIFSKEITSGSVLTMEQMKDI
jgi:benzil reductase ((S)-benzoin forming)